LLLIFFFGCRTNNKKNSENITIPVVKIPESVTGAYNISDTTKYKLIPLETHNEGLIARVKKVIFYNNNFYILDFYGKRIIVFDEKGRYIQKLEKIGKGPGEYIGLMDFYICNDILYTLSNHGHIINMFNAKDFKYIDNVRTPKNICATELYVNERFTYLSQIYPYLPKNNFTLYCLETENMTKILSEKFMFEYNYYSNTGIQSSGDFFGNSTTNGQLYSLQFDNTIYTINKDKVSGKCKLDFGKLNIPVDILKSEYGQFENYISKNNYRAINSKVEYNDNLLISIYDHELLQNVYAFINDKKMYIRTFKKIIFTDYDINIKMISGIHPQGFIGIISSVDIVEKLYKIKEDEIKNERQLDFTKRYSENSNPIIIVFKYE
jgi:hypothetical protein